MRKLLANFICLFIPKKEQRKRIRSALLLGGYKILGGGNQIIVEENGRERFLRKKERIPGLNIRIKGCNNRIKLHLPIRAADSCIWIKNDNASVEIGPSREFFNSLVYIARAEHQKCVIGANTTVSGAQIVLTETSAECHIGKNCMISHGVIIRGSDGHSITDPKTKKILNAPVSPLIIGDHCWICENTTILRKARIPNHTIIGNGSIVTKVFSEEYTALAGNPARVVSRNVSWIPENEYEFINGLKCIF